MHVFVFVFVDSVVLGAIVGISVGVGVYIGNNIWYWFLIFYWHRYFALLQEFVIGEGVWCCLLCWH